MPASNRHTRRTSVPKTRCRRGSDPTSASNATISDSTARANRASRKPPARESRSPNKGQLVHIQKGSCARIVERPTCDRFSDSRKGWPSKSASQTKGPSTRYAARRTTLPYVRQPPGRAWPSWQAPQRHEGNEIIRRRANNSESRGWSAESHTPPMIGGKFRDWLWCVVVDVASDGGDSTFTRKPVCRSRIASPTISWYAGLTRILSLTGRCALPGSSGALRH